MQYDKNRFKIYALPHPNVLFLVLNPVLIINELIFGQRAPKVTLIDQKSDKPLMERIYIPCPHCETLNNSRLWEKWNSFGHWFGLLSRCGISQQGSSAEDGLKKKKKD